jgi:hypothetical protein
MDVVVLTLTTGCYSSTDWQVLGVHRSTEGAKHSARSHFEEAVRQYAAQYQPDHKVPPKTEPQVREVLDALTLYDGDELRLDMQKASNSQGTMMWHFEDWIYEWWHIHRLLD